MHHTSKICDQKYFYNIFTFQGFYDFIQTMAPREMKFSNIPLTATSVMCFVLHFNPFWRSVQDTPNEAINVINVF